MNGAVSIESWGVKTVALGLTQAIPDGASVATGPDGTAVLAHGSETITLLPSSRVVLTDSLLSSSTSIFQQLGDVLFKVGKQDHPHFQVDTPYLAAIVKGTTFTVHVDADGARVFVSEGVVEVSTEWRESVVSTHTGETARVLGERPAQIEMLNGGHVSRTVVGAELPGGGGLSLRTAQDPPPHGDARNLVLATLASNYQARSSASTQIPSGSALAMSSPRNGAPAGTQPTADGKITGAGRREDDVRQAGDGDPVRVGKDKRDKTAVVALADDKHRGRATRVNDREPRDRETSTNASLVGSTSRRDVLLAVHQPPWYGNFPIWHVLAAIAGLLTIVSIRGFLLMLRRARNSRSAGTWH